VQSQLKIYKASAGSGKTYTLAKSYVKILIQNPYHYKNILAITFTKKATAEMKNRILLFLQQIKEDTNKKLSESIIDEIRNEFNLDVSNFIRQNADKAIQLILHDYAHFQVTTIDSFFQLIIRSFAKELKLPIGMQVEIDSEKVLNKSVQILLESYGKEDVALSTWLENFVYKNIDNEKGWNIEKPIKNIGKELLKEEYTLIKKDIETIEKTNFNQYDDVAIQQQKIVTDYKKYIKSNGNKAAEIIENNNIDVNLFSHKKSSVGGFVEKAKNGIVESYINVQKMLDGEKALFPKDTMSSFPAEVDRITAIWLNELHTILQNIINYHEENLQAYNSAQNILKNIYAMALLDELSNKLSEYRNQENIILMSDAAYFISKIAAEEATPFIYEKISSFINFILIDEFQDTSALQWKSLIPIVIEILSKGYGLSLIVGDAKQSIYRWRGGKMELILNQIDEDLAPYQELKQEINLNDNYRSYTTIINFNNTFFTQAIAHQPDLDLLQKAYFKHQQEAKNQQFQGLVSCQWLPENETGDIAFVQTLQMLNDLNTRYQWKDIAILVRDNKEASELAEYFQQHATHIPFVSGESLRIYNHISIQLMISTLEYIVFPDNKYYQYKLENTFCLYFEQQNTNEILAQKNLFYFQQYFKKEEFDFASIQDEMLTIVISKIMSLYNIDKESNVFILRFLDDVHKFCQNNSNNILAYLTYWQEQKTKISILPPEDIDAVQILTIHKSKGLEFPVVILPFANWSLTPKTNTTFWTEDFKYIKNNHAIPLSFTNSLENSDFKAAFFNEKQLTYIDNINNLYVAFTRAEKELYIFCKDLPRDKHNKIKEIDDIKSVDKLLYKTLSSINDFSAYFVDETTFVMGNEVPTNKKTETTQQTYFNFAPTLVHNNFEVNAPNYADEFTIKGEIIHQLMMHLHDKKSWNYQLNKIKYNFNLDDIVLKKYKNIQENIFNLFSQNHFLDDAHTYYYEQDVFFQNKTWRADIAIETSNKIIIIDYKTGQEDKKHETQVLQYKNAYQSIFKKETNVFLLYTDNMKLKSIQA
jgi:ATP-dependent helicase/nuclease subunit A